MLTQVILQTSNPMTLNIGGVDPDDILILTSMSGLSPTDITLFTGDFAGDGGFYQGRRVSTRNPVFNFKLNPDYKNDITVSDIRQLLYAQFLEPMASGDGVQVLLRDDKLPEMYFIGYTEKMPMEIFDRNPTAQVSMICVDPYLRSASETIENDPSGWLSTPIEYDGSADTGIELEIKVMSDGPDQLTIELEDQVMKMSSYYQTDDLLLINTNPGSRSIKNKRGVYDPVDVMGELSSGSDWLSLRKRTNTLSVRGLDGPGNFVITKYKYRAAWWGV